MSEDNMNPARVIGPGTFSPDDPDGSKGRKSLEKTLAEKGVTIPTEDKVTCKVSEEPTFVGLDLSLCSTGFCIKRGSVVTLETIKTEPKNFKDDLVRMIHIRDTITRKIPRDVVMICIEDFFSGIHAGSGTRLAMLASAVRIALYEKKMSFTVVSPNSLKKWIIGKGVGQKDLIVREVYKRYAIEAANDDEADAVVLAYIAEHFSRTLNGEKMDGVPKYQQEVVQNMMKTKSERGFNLQ